MENSEDTVRKTAQQSYKTRNYSFKDKWISLFLLTAWPTIVITEKGELQDYCEADAFTANCPYSEVVVIEEASYGRMRLGSCLKLDAGFMGCQSDVRPLLDKLCSGRDACEIDVRDLMVKTDPCPSDLRSYLQVKYTCLPVLTPSDNCCTFHGDHVRLEATRGILASSITDKTGCGSYECPWVLTAQHGQVFNFTLYDFAIIEKNTSLSDGIVEDSENQMCNIYATIRDKSSSNVVTLCEGKERITHVYTSESNRVEIRSQPQGMLYSFLIQYEAFGCPDPIPPSYGEFERMNDQATIRCIYERDITWNITCRNGQWDGSIGNCTLPKPEIMQSIEQPGTTILVNAGPVLIIIMIIAVAIIISLVIMAAGITYLKKHPRNQNNLERGYHMSAMYTHRENQNATFKSGVETMPAKAIYIRKGGTASNMPWQYTRPLPQPGNYANAPLSYKRPEKITDHEVKYYVLDPESSNSLGNNEVNVI